MVCFPSTICNLKRYATFIVDCTCELSELLSPFLHVTQFPPSNFMLLQGQVPFKDVTVDFTQEERQQLDPAEKTTYRDMMLGKYSHLISVGEESLFSELVLCGGF